MRGLKNLIALLVKSCPLLIDMAEESLNSSQLNILSLATSPAANPTPSEQESSESSSNFCFNKSKKKKQK